MRSFSCRDDSSYIAQGDNQNLGQHCIHAFPQIVECASTRAPNQFRHLCNPLKIRCVGILLWPMNISFLG